MNSLANRTVTTALALGSMLLAGPASAIIHDQLPISFGFDQTDSGDPSALLHSDQTEMPRLLKGVNDKQSDRTLPNTPGDTRGVI